MHVPASAQDILNAMAGVSYLIDPQCRLVAVGLYNWNQFAADNGGEALIDGAGVVGASIYDFISGDAVADAYRRVFEAVITRKRNEMRLVCRCDSPEVKRRLMLTVGPVFSDRVLQLILVQSTIMAEQAKPPDAVFPFGDNNRYGAEAGGERSVVRELSMCSLCNRVRVGDGDSGERARWMRPEDYKRRGGALDVAVRHDVCPRCVGRLDGDPR